MEFILPASKYPDKICKIDDEYWDWFIQLKWHMVNMSEIFYLVHYDVELKRHLCLHRYILGDKEGFDIDHINHDGLDNRRCNLRHATCSQNMMNSRPKSGKFTSCYRGVYYYGNTWMAQLTINRKHVFLGKFATELEAAKAYDEKAKELFGEFANLNLSPSLKDALGVY